LFMVQRCKFSIELKNFPPDLSGEPFLARETDVAFRRSIEEIKQN
jgi:hypothetical protein